MFCRSDKQRYALADRVEPCLCNQVSARRIDPFFSRSEPRWHCQSREAYGPDKTTVFDDIHETFGGFGVAIRFAGAFSLRPS
jgi:hypothetical protein